MRLLTLIAALLIGTVAMAQEEISKEEKTRGLKKISSPGDPADRTYGFDIDLSALSSLESLEALESLEGLEVLEELEINLGQLESLEVLEEMEIGGMESLEVIMEMNQEIMESIDIESIVEMSIDVSVEVLEGLQDMEVELDAPRVRRAQQ